MRVAFHGRINTGKTTASRILQYYRICDLIDSGDLDELYCPNREDLVKSIDLDELSRIPIFSFADPIRESVASIAPVTTSELKMQEVKRRKFKGKDYRWWLRFFGDQIRGKDEDAFVNVMKSRIVDKENVIIDDLRFNNELEFLKDEGFTLVKITKPWGKKDLHHSDWDLEYYKYWDHVINNDNDLENFIEKLYDVYEDN